MHHQNFSFIHRLGKVKNEIYEVYLNQMIKEFATSLIGIFIPLYLLSVGFSINWAIGYMAVYLLFLGLTSPIVADVAPKLGLKNAVILSMPMLIIFYTILLFFLQANPATLVVAAAIQGLATAFYWIPLNSVFIKHSDKVHEGKQVSHLMALPKLATLFAPLVGGIILAGIGFSNTFYIVIALLLLSILPLTLTKGDDRGFNFGVRKFNPFVHRHFSATFFFQGGAFVISDLMWPLFIFTQLPSFTFIGFTSTISGFGVSIVILVIGKVTKSTNTLKTIKLAGVGFAATWFARIFFTNPVEIVIISFLSGCFAAAISVSMFAGFCYRFREKNILGSMVFRETWLTFGRLFVLALLLLFAGNKFEFSFILAGVLSLLFLLVK